MKTFRDILKERGDGYILYITYDITLNGKLCTLRDLSYFKLNDLYENISYDLLLDTNSLCVLDKPPYEVWEIYADEADVVARMEELVRENLDKYGVYGHALQTMLRCKEKIFKLDNTNIQYFNKI